MSLLTVGHGPLDRDSLAALLTGAGVELLVDVRRFPGSRNNPDVKREAVEEWSAAAGITYVWEPRLGGRRHLGKDADAASPDQWWRVAAFRAYAGYTRTEGFTAAMDDLVARTRDQRVAVMCSESVWWRCHRRLIADVAALGRGLDVAHLMPTGVLSIHVTSAGARRTGDGTLVWDGTDET
ncbi:DUF488 domain-containing protein [Georgenia sp. MJ206]|uniref:DUF488 domain-containing protein n=1 Tax=Georgenia wangjunii TaxID=3117730 RepID=UPI002F26A9CE